ncbi:MAG: UDP-N-acetylglucosamine 2-epimerase (non-hydrolyzing) [Candidatus Margulisbacteria bacterium]|nr:UDP-N-acetylglucosamine 2-epimerase (non-hydrolyzing) [Candidatus Margulisiibacteriota bacterium]
MKKIRFIFGTRPEAIKCAPLIIELKKHPQQFDVTVLVTAQHREMLDQVISFFEIPVDDDLNLMTPNQNLSQLTSDAIRQITPILKKNRPDVVIVQGDTTTAYVGALAAFYQKIPVAHLEAGLRSFDPYSPFPEEMNRKLISQLATYHFAPTDKAVENLNTEGIKKHVYMVGNTVVDALHIGLEKLKQLDRTPIQSHFSQVNFSNRIIYVTGHRRENLGEPLTNICQALSDITENFEDVEIIYPVHKNPQVQDIVQKALSGKPRIHLIDPLDYTHQLWLMEKCHFIITDSGGIQEEAPSLGKPVLVTRNVTERTEGIQNGSAKLVGSDTQSILESASQLLSGNNLFDRMSASGNPYGDGQAVERVVGVLGKSLN